MKSTFFTRTLGVMLAVLALTFGTVGVTQAQQQGGAPQQGDPQMQLQQLQQRLMAIQQQAIENNPQLQEEADELEDLVIRTMEDAGFDPESGLARLEELQAEFQNEDLSDERRQAILEEAQELQMELQEGQQLAMQDEEVVRAQERFQDNMLDAMRAEDPETDELLAVFEQMQSQMQQQMPQQQQPRQ
ncbi:MAG: hypothetical protein JJU06_02880 [Ectothiorhodospiraceae bacterium]|nr:hypothetical protein [Ectothiorhodospiraceae bacterium]